jgi:hypothetical protein
MEQFDYTQPAELYASASRKSTRRPVMYHRFDSAAEAIRFALERLPGELLTGAVLEVGDDRLEAQDIKTLYESESFPLPRNGGEQRH